MVVVSLALATICFLGKCHPVLIGNNTPTGVYALRHLRTDQPGYGGDVIGFKETDDRMYAIHRIWLLNPKQHRQERMKSLYVKDHYISSGCINVEPEVYEELVDCCSRDYLTIR